jgi:hypothetical protein
VPKKFGLVEAELRCAQNVPAQESESALSFDTLKAPGRELLNTPVAHGIGSDGDRSVDPNFVPCIGSYFGVPAVNLKRRSKRSNELIDSVLPLLLETIRRRLCTMPNLTLHCSVEVPGASVTLALPGY